MERLNALEAKFTLGIITPAEMAELTALRSALSLANAAVGERIMPLSDIGVGLNGSIIARLSRCGIRLESGGGGLSADAFNSLLGLTGVNQIPDFSTLKTTEAVKKVVAQINLAIKSKGIKFLCTPVKWVETTIKTRNGEDVILDLRLSLSSQIAGVQGAWTNQPLTLKGFKSKIKDIQTSQLLASLDAYIGEDSVTEIDENVKSTLMNITFREWFIEGSAIISPLEFEDAK